MPTNTNSAQPMLTVKQAATALSVSTKTVRRLIKDGRLRHHRIGGQDKPLVRIAPEDLRAYLASTRS